MSARGGGHSVVTMPRRHRIRRVIGLALALLAVFALFGGLFVPIDVILRDPAIVASPERWVFGWFVAVGLAMALWPTARRVQA